MSRTHINHARSWTDFADTIPVIHESTHTSCVASPACAGDCKQGRNPCPTPDKCVTTPSGYSRAWWIAVLLCLAAAIWLAIAPPAEAHPITCTASRTCA